MYPKAHFQKAETAGHCSYQLLIHVEKTAPIEIGALGRHRFDQGWYLYTGSARRNLNARLSRHLRKNKKLRWHIDYLLSAPSARVVAVFTSSIGECRWNQSVKGRVTTPRFGASDCKDGCGAHLKRITENTAKRLLAQKRRKTLCFKIEKMGRS